MADHASRAHSRFAASAAERWILCPGSIALCDGAPELESPYSKEGTLAHEWLEYKLCGGAKPKQDATPEMLEAIAEFKKIVKEFVVFPATGIIEKQVFFASNNDVGGTLDYGMYNEVLKTLWIIDFKYGAGVFVNAKGNKQTRVYAQGGIDTYGWNPEKIIIIIVIIIIIYISHKIFTTIIFSIYKYKIKIRFNRFHFYFR